MRKLTTMLLAVLLAATLCFGATAETIDYTGLWVLSGIQSAGITLDPSTMGESADMSIMLNADGSCALYAMGQEEPGTWEPSENGVSVTDAEGVTEFTLVNGALTMTQDGMTMIFSYAGYAQVLTNLTVADFNGTWELIRLEMAEGYVEQADLGAAMTIVLQDGTGRVEMVTNTTLTYDCLCEIEEIEDFGTIMNAMFIDPATGEPDGSGMTLLLYDDGELVWYEYDGQAEYYYCFVRTDVEAAAE